jgi:Winged helix DNA-binding domain
VTVEARLAAQRLSLRAPSALDAARSVVGVQAQDVRAAGLALRSRVRGLERADLDGLVRTWTVRGTLHLTDPADRTWLHALTAAGNLRTFERMLERRGALELARRVRPDDVPRTRAELMPPELTGPAVNVVLPWLAAQGRLLGLPDGRFVAADPPPPVDADEALATLGRRYFAGYASADPEDLAWWSGLGLRVARRALEAAGGFPPAPPPPAPPALLLAPFDTLLLGYRSREWVVAAAHADRVLRGGGMVRAVVLVNGVAAGNWSAAGGRVSIEWWGPPAAEPTLAAEIADVERFLS